MRFFDAVLVGLVWGGMLGGTARLAAAPVLWTGYDFAFEKPFGTDPTSPANQDRITERVILTRAATQGIFNIAQESAFGSASPADTEWAFSANNPGKSLAAVNWQGLKFEAWRVAIANRPPDTVGQDAVVHLIQDDIYLDIRFTSWGGAGSGSFAYVRAVPPQPYACGDLDRDRDVDSSDLVGFLGNWTGDSPSNDSNLGGDCDADGDVDSADLVDFLADWTGDLSPAPVATVPEPTGAGLVVGGLLLIVRRTSRVRRLPDLA